MNSKTKVADPGSNPGSPSKLSIKSSIDHTRTFLPLRPMATAGVSGKKISIRIEGNFPYFSYLSLSAGREILLTKKEACRLASALLKLAKELQ